MVEPTRCQREVLRCVALLEARGEQPTLGKLAKLLGITRGGVAYHVRRLRALGKIG